MIDIKIDDLEISVKPNISILEACKLIGIHIPRFCYHELLSVSGNCRMCLVEIENAEKPAASCVTEVENGMSILSNTPFVLKARENVVEALLLNHPLDCPICDQAGECDLQDQVKKHGSNYSRYFFKKTSVEDKYCGPLIKTVMTRCIACTRCVRYTSEIAGLDFYGTLNRGGNTEISPYVPSFFKSEISGNVIDLCPVGALTSRPYASKARPWELRLAETIDVSDSFHSTVYVNFKETEIVRVSSKASVDFNINLISDKARYNYDANSINRIIAASGPSTVTKDKKVKLGWKKLLPKLESLVLDSKVNFFVDEKIDFDSLLMLQKIQMMYPTNVSVKSLTLNKNGNFYTNTNLNLDEIVNNVDGCVFFLGTNPKIENAILNAKIRIKLKDNLVKLFSSGLNFDYNFLNSFINLNASKMFRGIDGKIKGFGDSMAQSKRSLIVVGNSLKNRVSNLNSLQTVIKKMIPTATVLYAGLYANTEAFNLVKFQNVSAYDLKQKKVNFFAKTEDNVLVRNILKKSSDKSIWFNTHNSDIAEEASYVLPAASHFEQERTYLNFEHQLHTTSKIVEICKACKSLDSLLAILYRFSSTQVLNETKVYDYLKESSNASQNLKNINKSFINSLSILGNVEKVQVSKYPLIQEIGNFYLSDTFSRNSAIMHSCSNEMLETSSNISNT